MGCIGPPAPSMEITQQLSDCAKEQGLDEEQAVAAGLLEKSGEFHETGGEIYQAR